MYFHFSISKLQAVTSFCFGDEVGKSALFRMKCKIGILSANQGKIKMFYFKAGIFSQKEGQAQGPPSDYRPVNFLNFSTSNEIQSHMNGSVSQIRIVFSNLFNNYLKIYFKIGS